MPQQHTIKNPIHAEGIGLHSGKLVNLTARPAPPNTGIIFRRVDCDPVADLPVSVGAIEEALLCTRLTVDGKSISTIEHLMAALCALQIDNIIIEVNADEVPVLDGSSSPYIFLLQSAGVEKQDEDRRFLKIKKTVRLEDGDRFAELSPQAKGLSFDYSIDFDHPVIANTTQSISYQFHPMTFIKEISRARTFGFAADLEKLHKNNLALGGGLDNAVGIGDEEVLNPEGLRYPDEFVKHKLLDAIGDLYVAGQIIGHFSGHKTSHAINNQLLRKVFSDPSHFEWVD